MATQYEPEEAEGRHIDGDACPSFEGRAEEALKGAVGEDSADAHRTPLHLVHHVLAVNLQVGAPELEQGGGDHEAESEAESHERKGLNEQLVNQVEHNSPRC